MSNRGEPAAYLPLAEAAVRLGLSVDAARKRADRGQLTGAYKAGGRWYVPAPPGLPDDGGRTADRSAVSQVDASTALAAQVLVELRGIRLALEALEERSRPVALTGPAHATSGAVPPGRRAGPSQAPRWWGRWWEVLFP